MFEKQLKNLYTNLYDLTNYLILLFYQTDCKYTCTRIKIDKLLSILAFKYAVNCKKLFGEKNIYKYDECGTL